MLQNVSKPVRINTKYLDRARAIAIAIAKADDVLMSEGDILELALERGLSALESDYKISTPDLAAGRKVQK